MDGRVFRIELPPSIRVHPNINIKNIKKYFGNSPQDSEDIFPTQLVSELELRKHETVECILDRRERHGKLEYLVKWKSSPAHESSWIPYQELASMHPIMVRRFDAALDYLQTPEDLPSEGGGVSRQSLRLRSHQGSQSHDPESRGNI